LAVSITEAGLAAVPRPKLSRQILSHFPACDVSTDKACLRQADQLQFTADKPLNAGHTWC